MSKTNAIPYNSSWINYLTGRVEQLPGRSWWYYFGFGVILIAVLTTMLWVEGAAPVGTFLPVHIYLAAAIAFILAVIYYFDQWAINALERIKPLLNINEEKYLEFQYRLSNLPSSLSVLASILTILFVLLTEYISGGAYQVEALNSYPISMVFLRGIYLICWWFFGVFIYHSIYQLRLINRIYSHYTRIDLFRLEPLYGFSSLAALTAISLIVLPYGFFFINPTIQLHDPITLSTYLVITLIAVCTFFLPQLGIHRLQTEEKERLLDEAYESYEFTIEALHYQVKDNEFKDMMNVSMAFSSLEMEISTIKAISTWPWQPGTLRWLFTALLLPLLMWVAQFFLGQFLSS